VRLPLRFTIAAAILVLASAFFAFGTLVPLFARKPSVPLVLIFGLQTILFLGAGIAVMVRATKVAPWVLGLGSAWYIAVFAATGLHGYVGYAAAVFLGWFVYDYNRFVKKTRAAQ
jgi:hypothetical protein